MFVKIGTPYDPHSELERHSLFPPITSFHVSFPKGRKWWQDPAFYTYLETQAIKLLVDSSYAKTLLQAHVNVKFTFYQSFYEVGYESYQIKTATTPLPSILKNPTPNDCYVVNRPPDLHMVFTIARSRMPPLMYNPSPYPECKCGQHNDSPLPPMADRDHRPHFWYPPLNAPQPGDYDVMSI